MKENGTMICEREKVTKDMSTETHIEVTFTKEKLMAKELIPGQMEKHIQEIG